MSCNTNRCNWYMYGGLVCYVIQHGKSLWDQFSPVPNDNFAKEMQFSLLGGTLFDGESVYGHPSHRRLAGLVCRYGQSDLDLLGVNHVLSRFLPFAAAHRRVLPPVIKTHRNRRCNSGFLFTNKNENDSRGNKRPNSVNQDIILARKVYEPLAFCRRPKKNPLNW